jgi:hypothetical protein
MVIESITFILESVTEEKMESKYILCTCWDVMMKHAMYSLTYAIRKVIEKLMFSIWLLQAFS